MIGDRPSTASKRTRDTTTIAARATATPRIATRKFGRGSRTGKLFPILKFPSDTIDETLKYFWTLLRWRMSQINKILPKKRSSWQEL